jgi:hypothetical protein
LKIIDKIASTVILNTGENIQIGPILLMNTASGKKLRISIEISEEINPSGRKENEET